jgi:diaminohydroxyphosphoribosylaminopyrimidine deaminase/5-amino-6-(5-phosphoribosylamino)uracil reductase
VIFDAHVCTPPGARVLSTLDTGPVIIVVTGRGVEVSPDRARVLEAAGAELLVVDRSEIGPSITRLLDRGVQSLLFEGGARLHRAVWQAGLADRIEAWVTPRVLGPEGVPWLSPGELSLAALHDLRVEPCGDDVRVEGYVHRVD